jgi:uncharacterized Tic20 family protein
VSNQPSPWGNYQFAPSTQSTGGGYSLPPPDQRYDPTDDAAKKALGFGIGSIVLCCCIAGTVMGVLAIMYGWNASQSDNPSNRTMGIAGMVCGIVGVVISIALTILGIVLQVTGALIE